MIKVNPSNVVAQKLRDMADLIEAGKVQLMRAETSRVALSLGHDRFSAGFPYEYIPAGPVESELKLVLRWVKD
jgi:hypothetical protein